MKLKELESVIMSPNAGIYLDDKFVCTMMTFRSRTDFEKALRNVEVVDIVCGEEGVRIMCRSEENDKI